MLFDLKSSRGVGLFDYTENHRRRRIEAGFTVPVPKAKTDGAPVPAFVNFGRWVVQCPDCGTGELVDRDDLRFWCVHCHNASILNAWRRVAWPHSAAKIEELLLSRSSVDTRNWEPGESLARLRSENKAHGVTL